MILFVLVLVVTTRIRAFRDSALAFLLFGEGASIRGWSEIVATVDNPILLMTLLSLLYAGTIIYYYFSATRQKDWEN